LEEYQTPDEIAQLSIVEIEQALSSARGSEDLLLVADRAWRFGNLPEDQLSQFTLPNKDIGWLRVFCQVSRALLELERSKREH
jgi:hypothetical protein